MAGMKNAYTPFRVLKAEAEPGRPIALTVQNRFNFTDLGDVRIAWDLNGRAKGAAMAKLAPHATGVVVIQASGTKPGDRVTLVVTDRRGVEVAREVVVVGGAAPAAPEPWGRGRCRRSPGGACRRGEGARAGGRRLMPAATPDGAAAES